MPDRQPTGQARWRRARRLSEIARVRLPDFPASTATRPISRGVSAIFSHRAPSACRLWSCTRPVLQRQYAAVRRRLGLDGVARRAGSPTQAAPPETPPISRLRTVPSRRRRAASEVSSEISAQASGLARDFRPLTNRYAPAPRCRALRVGARGDGETDAGQRTQNQFVRPSRRPRQPQCASCARASRISPNTNRSAERGTGQRQPAISMGFTGRRSSRSSSAPHAAAVASSRHRGIHLATSAGVERGSFAACRSTRRDRRSSWPGRCLSASAPAHLFAGRPLLR